jgi:O-methyltransferase involved in polyketide biosynthesis
MPDLPEFDTTVASPARVWNYWLGGKDHFAVDREAAEKVVAVYPSLPQIALATRRFLVDAVRLLTDTYGVRQFLDIGTGLPTADNTHEVAQRLAPESRIVYVDFDPSVLRHAQALLTSTPEGRTDYIQADLRAPETILSAAARTLDFSKPVAVLLIAVLHFIPDADGPHEIVQRLLDAVPPGSYLVVQHAPSDIRGDEMAASARHYNAAAAASIGARTRDEVARFFDGLEMIGPGLVNLPQWWAQERSDDRGVTSYVGIGRKPLPSHHPAVTGRIGGRPKRSNKDASNVVISAIRPRPVRSTSSLNGR